MKGGGCYSSLAVGVCVSVVFSSYGLGEEAVCQSAGVGLY